MPEGNGRGSAGVAAESERVVLSASDARWVMAVRVAASLQGGRAAILTPTLRHKLVARAVASGLREFDANLIIAIVQDAARTTGAPLSRDVADRLRYVRGQRARQRSIAVSIFSSAVIAMVAFVVLVGWILGG